MCGQALIIKAPNLIAYVECRHIFANGLDFSGKVSARSGRLRFPQSRKKLYYKWFSSKHGAIRSIDGCSMNPYQYFIFFWRWNRDIFDADHIGRAVFRTDCCFHNFFFLVFKNKPGTSGSEKIQIVRHTHSFQVHFHRSIRCFSFFYLNSWYCFI